MKVQQALPGFTVPADFSKAAPIPVLVSSKPINACETGSESLSHTDAAHQLPRQSRKIPSTALVLQQKFGVSKNICFVPNNGRIFFERKNGHFYPMPSKSMEPHQRETAFSLSFTRQGLMNLRHRYDEIHGATTFLHAFLKMERFCHDLHDMVRNPVFYPYFENEKFLMMPTVSYDPMGERHIGPKSLKLKDQGIVSCAWFIHPDLSSINDDTRTLLRELSEGAASPKPLVEKLRAQCESSAVDYSKQNVRDEKTIGQLKQNSEYLASILDLNASHIPLLRNLKEKTMRHLAEAYGVNEGDDVALYFHFPYVASTLTLHLHIRVNHGFHPFEEGKSFTVDELISGLSDGKTIDEIILERQNENNGRFFRTVADHEKKIYENIEGVTINENSANIHRLEHAKSDVNAVYSRDDLFRRK
ncbi:MAG TPA: hypothetical protein VF427_02490 [Noviherbaspirillum sp.]